MVCHCVAPRASNEPTDVDGQKGAEFPLHIECLAGGLRVMCAKQASGNS